MNYADLYMLSSKKSLNDVGNYIVSRRESQTHQNDEPRRSSGHLRRQSSEKELSNVKERLAISDTNGVFMRSLHKMWIEGQYCDVEICIENSLLKAHKVVLAGYSGYMRDILDLRENQAMRRIPLSGIKFSTMRDILFALYSGSLWTCQKTVRDILSVASFLRIPPVIETCHEFLSNHLTVENCLRTLQIANLYELAALLERTYTLACENFSRVCKQKQFLTLRYCELQSLLPREDMFASEMEIFNAVVSWIEADISSRLQYTARLMRHVRFSLIGEQDLIYKVKPSVFVAQVPEAMEYVADAISYHTLPYKRPLFPSSRTQPRSTLKHHSLIACGGLSLKKEGSLNDRVYCCDLESGKWEYLTTMPEPRHHHAAAVLGGYIYIAGGDSGDEHKDPSNKVWRYDTWRDEWLQVANMQSPREGFQMAAMDLRLYVVGGRGVNNETLSEVENYVPEQNSWSNVAPLSSSRRHVAVSSLHGYVYAVGGSNDNLVSRRVERYDPSANTWEHREAILKPRFSAALHAVKNSLWLVGGTIVEQSLQGSQVNGAPDIELYTPSSDQWTILQRNQAKNRSLQYREDNAYSNRSTSIISRRKSNVLTNKGTDAFQVDMPRSEAGSCYSKGRIFLIGGYSWLNRKRINNVECIDIDSLVKHVSFPKVPGVSSGQDIDKKEVEHYPLRCTGIACVSLVLMRKPEVPEKMHRGSVSSNNT